MRCYIYTHFPTKPYRPSCGYTKVPTRRSVGTLPNPSQLHQNRLTPLQLHIKHPLISLLVPTITYPQPSSPPHNPTRPHTTLLAPTLPYLPPYNSTHPHSHISLLFPLRPHTTLLAPTQPTSPPHNPTRPHSHQISGNKNTTLIAVEGSHRKLSIYLN